MDIMKMQEDLHKFIIARPNMLEYLSDKIGLSVQETSLLITSASGSNGKNIAVMLRLYELMKEALVKELEANRGKMLQELRNFKAYNSVDLFTLAYRLGLKPDKVLGIIIRDDSDIGEIYSVYEEMNKLNLEKSNAAKVINDMERQFEEQIDKPKAM